MRFLKGFYQFWYDFIIGDDWKIAAAVVVVLLAGFGIVKSGSYNPAVLTVALAVAVAAAFTVALLIDVRPKKK
jgi:heme A synthase